MKDLTTIILFIILLFMLAGSAIKVEQLTEHITRLQNLVFLLEEGK